MILTLMIIVGICIYIMGFGFSLSYIAHSKYGLISDMGPDLSFFSCILWPIFWLIFTGCLLGRGVAKENG